MYAPQVIHSIETGTPRRIFGNVPNTGLITNLPAGYTVVSVGELAVQVAVGGDPRLSARPR